MTSHDSVLLKTDIPYLKLHNRGKVREIFEIDDNLLLVATDRISAFDHILQMASRIRAEPYTHVRVLVQADKRVNGKSLNHDGDRWN